MIVNGAASISLRYYKSSLVIVNGAASVAATNGGSGELRPLEYDRYF